LSFIIGYIKGLKYGNLDQVFLSARKEDKGVKVEIFLGYFSRLGCSSSDLI